MRMDRCEAHAGALAARAYKARQAAGPFDGISDPQARRRAVMLEAERQLEPDRAAIRVGVAADLDRWSRDVPAAPTEARLAKIRRGVEADVTRWEGELKA